ncbi:glycerophosphoryl diester phosphodiesterase membrane domain-containing protein [Pontixanthobacter sp. CEM42]|uniref:glycerophosphoryl diester phosphodiesterase membrane domain-containing protein n=1 Tax=Pontixanthobacter sp. CEM42 TaxID=2792077 RepID=UPI001ADF2B18|nr:glycerophosphoryl diester phosphodiesterase membrane domain-containing protein [Pontixanthobacter sp. CEM42]
MKFDLDKAWNEAVTMLRSNLDVLSVVAGMFFFLPSLATTLLIPVDHLQALSDDPDRLNAAMLALLSEHWPVIAIYVVLAIIGSLALFALLGKGHRPTVGEALKIGVIGCLPYAVSLVLFVVIAMIIAVIFGVVAGVAGLAIINLIMSVAAFTCIFYVGTRLLLAGPVIAIEQNYNPISAMVRSWKLIGGHTRKVLIFMVLVFIAVFVVGLVSSQIIALFSALIGSGQIALWLEGILSGILGALISTLLLAIYTAIHRQLAGQPTETLSDTFD